MVFYVQREVITAVSYCFLPCAPVDAPSRSPGKKVFGLSHEAEPWELRDAFRQVGVPLSNRSENTEDSSLLCM